MHQAVGGLTAAAAAAAADAVGARRRGACVASYEAEAGCCSEPSWVNSHAMGICPLGSLTPTCVVV